MPAPLAPVRGVTQREDENPMDGQAKYGRAERGNRPPSGRQGGARGEHRSAPSQRYSPSPTRDMQKDTSARSHKAVYTVVEGKDDKSFWRQVGVAFLNRDGSINILLDALPVNGKLQIRDAETAGHAGEAGGEGTDRPEGNGPDYPDADR